MGCHPNDFTTAEWAEVYREAASQNKTVPGVIQAIQEQYRPVDRPTRWSESSPQERETAYLRDALTLSRQETMRAQEGLRDNTLLARELRAAREHSAAMERASVAYRDQLATAQSELARLRAAPDPFSRARSEALEATCREADKRLALKDAEIDSLKAACTEAGAALRHLQSRLKRGKAKPKRRRR